MEDFVADDEFCSDDVADCVLDVLVSAGVVGLSGSAVLGLDRRVTGVDREDMLRWLAAGAPAYAWVSEAPAAGDVDGQIITFFVMTVAAAEAAVGLAIVIALFRHRESLNPDAFTSLKW